MLKKKKKQDRLVRHLKLFYTAKGNLLLDSDTDLRSTHLERFLSRHGHHKQVESLRQAYTVSQTGTTYSRHNRWLRDKLYYSSFAVTAKKGRPFLETMAFGIRKRAMPWYEKDRLEHGTYVERCYQNPDGNFISMMTDQSMLLGTV